jgi:hypothetical protein
MAAEEIIRGGSLSAGNQNPEHGDTTQIKENDQII